MTRGHIVGAGLDRIAAWGQPREVAGIVGQGVRPIVGQRSALAKSLPRSFVGLPPQLDIGSDGLLPEIQVDIQREMRPDRFVIVTDGADTHEDMVLVRDIKVGTISINASQNPIPGTCFIPASVGSSIRAPVTASTSIGIQVLLEVEGLGGEDSISIYGGFFGPSAAPGAGLAGPAAEGGAAVAGIVGAAEDDAAGDVSSDDARMLPQSMVGIPVTAFTAGQSLYVQVPIQRDMRPDRLMLGFTCANNYLVQDIRVGTVSLNASLNPMPGGAFAPLSFGTRLRPPVTATPALGIGLRVQNLQAGPTTTPLMGGFFGPSRYAST